MLGIPADDLLSDGTTMGAVELLVKDLDGMIAFYSTGVTLDVLQYSGDTAVLGHDGRVVVRLRRVTDLPSWRPNQAGLFHTAVLFDDDAALACALASMARFAPGTFTGSADHLYSQAFYFTDPEGNGVELYADRPGRPGSTRRTACSAWPPTIWTRTSSCARICPWRRHSQPRHQPPHWVTSTCRWATFPPGASSTWTRSASR